MWKLRERDARELVHAEAAEQARILLEHADHLVEPPVEPHRFADRIGVRKQRVGDRVADHDHVARVLLVELRDVTAGRDA